MQSIDFGIFLNFKNLVGRFFVDLLLSFHRLLLFQLSLYLKSLTNAAISMATNMFILLVAINLVFHDNESNLCANTILI